MAIKDRQGKGNARALNARGSDRLPVAQPAPFSTLHSLLRTIEFLYSYITVKGKSEFLSFLITALKQQMNLSAPKNNFKDVGRGFNYD